MASAPSAGFDEGLLWSIVQAVEAETGDGFYRSLVRALSETLHVDYAFLSELTRGGTHFRSVYLYERGRFGENFEVPLAGTPCEAVLCGTPTFYPDRLRERFPKDGALADWQAESYGGVPLVDRAGVVCGHLAFVHRQPLADEGRVLAVMRVLAARAVAEFERQRAEAALRTSEERFARILASATDAILSFDARGIIQYANPAAAHVLRCRAEKLVGMPVARFTTPAGLERLRGGTQGADAPGSASHYVSESESLQALRADGTPFAFEATLSRSGAGADLLLTVIFRDLEERREEERALRELQQQNAYLREELDSVHPFEEIVGRSPALTRVLEQVDRVAPTDTAVLIEGETGTGKELVARALHARSGRRERPLVKVNCAALAPGLLESELFGHERGAFTGATQRRIGRFELADGGSLFLDEVGELPLGLQAKLLRVLQEQEFERVGGSRTLRVDVRVIAATNRDLAEEVRQGRFREDLHYRLRVFPVTLPPLRERTGDVPLLVEYLVGRHAPRLGRPVESVAPETLARLARYPWPGNVRELENVVERALILGRGNELRVPEEMLEGVPGASRPPASAGDGAGCASLAEFERDYIVAALRDTGWRIEGPRGAALRLGLNPSTLRSRLRKLGIQRDSREIP